MALYKELLGPVRGTNILGLCLEKWTPLRHGSFHIGWDWYDFRDSHDGLPEVSLTLYLGRREVLLTLVLRSTQLLDWERIAVYRSQKKKARRNA